MLGVALVCFVTVYSRSVVEEVQAMLRKPSPLHSWFPGLLLCLATCGCSLIENAAHTLVIQPLDYCLPEEQCRSSERHRRLAAAAWEETVQAALAHTYSCDYASGFQEGFADYLDAGPGNVPALPPRRYWRTTYQTPRGHQAILDWYAGFREGALAAADSGYRKFATLPSPYLTAPEFAPPESHAPGSPTADIVPMDEPETEMIPAPPPEMEPQQNEKQQTRASQLRHRKPSKHSTHTELVAQ
jgi:hypothetical protein